MKSSMNIRKATQKDIPFLDALLLQVLTVHHEGRPDLFKNGTRKYTEEELKELLKDEQKPIFVATEENGDVVGYAFCILEQHKDHNILTDIKTLYIDDLCVDQNKRGLGIGKALYDYVVRFAKDNGCHNLTLNVWSCNKAALRFYEKCGLAPQKIGMELIL